MSEGFRFIIIVVIAGGSALAHEVQTHQQIGDTAAAYLQQSLQYQNRPQLPSLMPLLEFGAVQEDEDPLPGAPCPFSISKLCPGRFYFHFDPALNFTGPAFQLLPAAGTFNILGGCRSELWGLQTTGCLASISGTTLFGIPFTAQTTQTNSNRWSQVLGTDSTGKPSQASITGFGYIVHLLEDLGSPPHTRNDAHPCILGISYCDPFEYSNDASLGGGRGVPSLSVALALPVGSVALIATNGFTKPDDFFTALQAFVSTNYYSSNTVFTVSGPCSVYQCAEDSRYIYAPCITSMNGFNLSAEAGTCKSVLIDATIQDLRKVAHKGYRYWQACAPIVLATFSELTCDRTLAEIDQAIAQEQFAELGPVIAQHVAAFIQFYAPVLSLQVQGNGTVTSTNIALPDGTSISGSFSCGTGTCSALFVQGAQVTLTANPASGSTITWGGDCASAGASTTVTVILADDKNCTVLFNPSTSPPSDFDLTLASGTCQTVPYPGFPMFVTHSITVSGTATGPGNGSGTAAAFGVCSGSCDLNRAQLLQQAQCGGWTSSSGGCSQDIGQPATINWQFNYFDVFYFQSIPPFLKNVTVNMRMIEVRPPMRSVERSLTLACQ